MLLVGVWNFNRQLAPKNVDSVEYNLPTSNCIVLEVSDNWVDTWSKAAVKKDLVIVKITTSLHGPKERLERPTQFPILRLNLRDSTLRSF